MPRPSAVKTPLVVWLIPFELVYRGSVLDTDVVDCTSLLDPRHAIIHPQISPQNKKKGAVRMFGILQIGPSYKAKKHPIPGSCIYGRIITHLRDTYVTPKTSHKRR